MSKSKAIGTLCETGVVRYARLAGFGLAERRALRGVHDVGDVLLTAFVIVECKGGHVAETASDAQIEKWLAETERERVNAAADVGLLVTKRKGYSADNAGQWWAHWRLGDLARLRGYPPTIAVADGAHVRMTLADALTQLRAGGYGDPLDMTLDTILEGNPS